MNLQEKPERCPLCGAAQSEPAGPIAQKYDCHTWAILREATEDWEVQQSSACLLIAESVEYIHSLEKELETAKSPPRHFHQSAENEGPVAAYIPVRPVVPDALPKLRAKAQVYLGMMQQALAVVIHQDPANSPEPDRLRRVYGPDMKRAVQQLADLREEVLFFIDLSNAPRR